MTLLLDKMKSIFYKIKFQSITNDKRFEYLQKIYLNEVAIIAYHHALEMSI